MSIKYLSKSCAKMNTFGLLLALATFVVACHIATAAPFENDDIERIINGQTATPGQFPYQASLRVWAQPQGAPRPSFIHFCGGSIISKRWILTAAHCLVELTDQNRVIIVLGTNHISQGGDRYQKERHIVHPKFDVNILNDVGLVKSKKDFVYSARVRPIELNTSPVGAGVTVTVSGWGDTKVGVSNNYSE